MRTAIVALEIFIPLYIFRLNEILKKTQNHSYGLTAKQLSLRHNETFLMLRVEATDALVGYAVEFLNFYRYAVVLLVRPDGMWEY